jgi:hypothetical protein
MSTGHDIIEDSILQFKGNIPDDVKGICLKYISEFHITYLIYPSSSSSKVKSEIEDVLHDILSNGGVKFDRDGNVKGYKYFIEYEFLSSIEKIMESVKGVKFAWIYPSKQAQACGTQP